MPVKMWVRKFKPLSYMRMYQRVNLRSSGSNGKLNKQQMECFKSLFEWRYQTSESNDESFEYTMTKALLNEISKALPKDVEEIKQLCGDTVPPLVEENVEDIKNLILKAIEDEPDTTTIVQLRKKEKPTKRKQGNNNAGSQAKKAATGNNAANAKKGRGAANNRGRGAYNNRGRGAYNNNNRGRGAYNNQGRGAYDRGVFNTRGRGAFQGYGSPYGGGYGASDGGQGFSHGGQGYSGMDPGMGGPNLESIIRNELYNALGNMQQQSGNFGGGYNQNYGGYW